MRWIPGEAIIAIHAELIKEHGGLPGPVDEQNLGSTLARPQNIHAYSENNPDLVALAAAYGYGFVRNHCFTDGNKRVALAAIDVFLQLNGFELAASEVEAVSIMLELAAGEMSEEDLTHWIRENQRPLTGGR